MNESQALDLSLKSAESIVRDYVTNLEVKNAGLQEQIGKLQKQIVKIECASLSDKHKIAALTKELSAYLKKGHVTVQMVNYGDVADK